jgi:hypothetical protein
MKGELEDRDGGNGGNEGDSTRALEDGHHGLEHNGSLSPLAFGLWVLLLFAGKSLQEATGKRLKARGQRQSALS